ncbi:hypothetical protein AB0I72_08825 [Nocardiopsis sp. NPDC049922]|uniref:hypothetical protein n=1 Tax=Nocardiopsis sp. NPDC049922 TaxID=3155157 RepID=UPI00340E2D2E
MTKTGDESGDGGGDGKNEGTAIDFERVRQFHQNFLVPLRDRVSEEITRFSPYAGEPPTDSHHILIGNGTYLPIADTLATEIDTGLSKMHSIMSGMESELLVISDRLNSTMVVFMELEDEQNLTAGELAAIFGTSTGSGTAAGTGGSGNVGGGGGGDDET